MSIMEKIISKPKRPFVTHVKVMGQYKLHLTFENGEERIFDVSPYLNTGKFAELRDVSMFNSVVVRFDAIQWANHLDIDPEFLYENSKEIKDKHTITTPA